MFVVWLFNTVGAPQVGRYGTVLPIFVHQGLAGQDIAVYGNGEGFEDLGHRIHDVQKLERAIGFRPRASIEMIIEPIVGGGEGHEDG